MPKIKNDIIKKYKETIIDDYKINDRKYLLISLIKQDLIDTKEEHVERLGLYEQADTYNYLLSEYESFGELLRVKISENETISDKEILERARELEQNIRIIITLKSKIIKFDEHIENVLSDKNYFIVNENKIYLTELAEFYYEVITDYLCSEMPF